MTDGEEKTDLIRDGLVMFQRAENKGIIFDMVVKHFKIHNKKVKFDFYTEILPQTKRIFEMEAGPNLGLLAEFMKNSSEYKIEKPVFVYDEEAGGVVSSGDFANGGILNLGYKRTLDLEFECKSNEDLFVNMVIPLSKHKRGVSVIFEKICDKGVFSNSGFFASIVGFFGLIFGIVFSVKFVIMLGFAFGLYYFMKREKIVKKLIYFF